MMGAAVNLHGYLGNKMILGGGGFSYNTHALKGIFKFFFIDAGHVP